MTRKPPTIFLSAAEASGDAHAAKLIRAIRARAGDVKFVGAAGPKMQAEGCEAVVDLTADASMVGGPFLRLGHYYRQVKRLQRAIREIKPDVVVPVDSPALNWHLAKAARKLSIPVVYYIAPQVWAWAPWRVKKLARLTSAVACILPFEQEYLRSRGVNATYVGHPLFDDIGPPGEEMPDLCEAWANGTWRVAFVPGSRPAEIRGHSAAMLELARSLRRRWPKCQCVFTAHDENAAKVIREVCGGDMFEPFDGPSAQKGDRHGFETAKSEPVPFSLAVGRTREVLAQSHFGVVKSGTVTLEAAWFGLPMVIVYRTGRLMGTLHRTLGRCRAIMPTPYLSLVNILAGKRLVEELMPWHGDYRRLEQTVLAEMEDIGRLSDLRQSLMDLVKPLQTTSAADNAAKLVLDFV